ncbi:MAG TPA: hypothetical protein VF240_19445 [Pyrinomonadaceae bacterium]
MESIRNLQRKLGGVGYATRVKLATLLLLALTALLTNLIYLRENRGLEPTTAGHDDINIYERRFGVLREALPARGVVGYLSDEQEVNEATKKYYLTQYTLAPLIVVRDADQALVVGDFARAREGAPETVAAQLRLIKDFGDGVALYAREER